MKTKFESTLVDINHNVWSLLLDVESEIEDGLIEFHCSNVILKNDSETLESDSLADIPDRFPEKEIEWLEMEIENFLSHEFEEQLSESSRSAEREHQNYRERH